MPEMIIRVEGKGNEFADVLMRHRMVEMPHHIPIRVVTLDHGMSSGAPSCTFIIELPHEGIVVLAQTSLKLFQLAACATYAKYGDATEGAFTAHITKGELTMHMSRAIECPGCHSQVPSTFKFCMECGLSLAH